MSIDHVVFGKRLAALQSSWKENASTMWGGATALLIATGASSDDLRYLKSLSVHLWLLGYELPGN